MELGSTGVSLYLGLHYGGEAYQRMKESQSVGGQKEGGWGGREDKILMTRSGEKLGGAAKQGGFG